MTQETLNKIFDYLVEYDYFTEKELLLVVKGWGDNEKTYNTVCQVRYGMDWDQLANEDNKIRLLIEAGY